MPTAIYPGTFDPVTYGHIDIAVRASKIFKKVIAVVASNPGKNPLFTVEERVDMVSEALAHVPHIEVISYSGLIVDCVREYNATAIIRGLRAISDFDYEFQMAFTNRNLLDSAETVFLMPSSEYIYLNSTLVKQIAQHGAGSQVCTFVPEFVKEQLIKKLKKNR
ncbi:pantetheine-phosphate adenylyltransferase [Chitinispirillales bacterium ANBcel5]|uniref:pantetheine-phosphate adenylyltransferase n=1 Tax=Cellulosispirillum alkaliphilum TaxID=3039283 RepID=UPI002A54C5D4|nr:pantetheine-phosphate adenylyltransferase [Chitinispirillales bacterium ANBcel5]